ncbi:MAG: RNA polymerase sigma factor [Eubacteriales bacterium]
MSLELKEEYKKIYAFCYFKVHNRDVAQDLTQETFLKYFETTHYLEKGKKLAFLYTIARNNCNYYFRQNRQTVNIDDLIELSDDTSEQLETVIAVRAAVSTLNSDEQEIVLLKYTGELGIGEIAEYLEISRFAVYRKLNVIEKKLKNVLRKEDFYG